jgi:Ni/Fe-hydrogenase subunit HybB-like protein
MMKKKIMNLASKFLLMCLMMGVSLSSFAQDNGPEMADTMRSNGKIYVVVAVCLTLLIGLFLYMIRVERMVRKLEKENNQLTQK